MTKSQLIELVSKKAHLTKKASEESISVLFEEIKKALEKGEKVVVSNFGTFYVSKVKDKEVTPFGQVEKKQIIKAHKIVNFRVGKNLKREVW